MSARPRSGSQSLARVVVAWILLLCTGHLHAADFDGDGIADMLFRNRSADGYRLAIAIGVEGRPGAGVQRAITLSTSKTRELGFAVRIADFDGDGKSDILSRDLVDQSIRIRLMNGASIRLQGAVSGLPSAAYSQMVSVADFDGDQRSDLLLRDTRTGAWFAYCMNGLAIKAGCAGQLGVATDRDWRLIAASDFDGDRRADLLLRRSDTGEWRMVRLDGTHVLAMSTPSFLPGSGWQLESVRDLNQDRRTDLMFRNIATGAWVTWYMNGGRYLPGSGATAITAATAWRLQSMTDLNGDGSADALLARFDTGEWRVDFMMGRLRLASSGTVAGGSRLTTRVSGAADYDGDGVREVLASTPHGWVTINVRAPGSPRERLLPVPAPDEWSTVCDVPRFAQFSLPRKPASAPSNSLFLAWQSPFTRTSGESLCINELAGFVVHYSRLEGGSSYTMRIGDPFANARLLGSLAPGTWRFTLRAIDTLGTLSPESRVTKILR